MSPVILLGLVVMWAVVLIPMWLRRHDETEESRSVERFTSAMHTLSRREAAADRRYVVMPHRSRSVDVHVSGASAERRSRVAALAARRAKARAGHRPISAATRRRRTLLGLFALVAITLAAAFEIGGMSLWALQFVVDAVFVAFVGHLVTRARQAAPARSTRRAPARRTQQARPARRAPAARQAQRPAARQRPAAAPRPARVADRELESTLDAMVSTEAREPVESVRIAPPTGRREVLFDQAAPEMTESTRVEPEEVAAAYAPVERSEPRRTAADAIFDQTAEVDLERREPRAPAPIDDDAFLDVTAADVAALAEEPQLEIGGAPWEPVPVPPPTYVSKPTAPPRRPRPPIFEPLLPPSETPAELDPVDDLEEILDRRWAVND